MSADETEWLEQARRDLEVARHLEASSYYEWAAYAAQQAGEKAVKALRIALGTEISEIKVHDVGKLLGTIPTRGRTRDPLLARAPDLDAHNQQARYPGMRGRGPGAPLKTYTKDEADEVIAIAGAVLAYATQLLTDAGEMWAKRTAANTVDARAT